VLQSLVALMRDLHEVSFVVVGHADTRGRPEANQRVSELRAASARDLLLKLGADAKRLTIVGRGSSQPLDPTDTPEAHAKNRRVELEVALPEASTPSQ
jgi:outer membrane protein OmpA-like peptidoglycan-associated protein